MTTAIDAAGRIVIPKAVRDAAGFQPGTPLEISYRDGRIEIAPAPLDVEIENRGGVAVATARQPVPVLTHEDVHRTLEELRGTR